MRLSMSGPLDRGGTVVVRPSNDKQPTYTNRGASSFKFDSSQSVSKLPGFQTLTLINLVSNIRLHWHNHLDLILPSNHLQCSLHCLSSWIRRLSPGLQVFQLSISQRYSVTITHFQTNLWLCHQLMYHSRPLKGAMYRCPQRRGTNYLLLLRRRWCQRMVLPQALTLHLWCQASGLWFHPVLFREGNFIHLAITTLPGPDFQPLPVNPFLPMHMGLHPSSLRLPNFEPLPGNIQNASSNNITVNPWRDADPQHHSAEFPPASNSSRYPLDNISKRLEYHLDSALQAALTIQTSEISPRAHNTLKALNALVSVDMPVSGPRTVASDPPARFKFVKKMTKWLRIPQSPKQDTPR